MTLRMRGLLLVLFSLMVVDAIIYPSAPRSADDGSIVCSSRPGQTSNISFYDFVFPDLQGNNVSFQKYKGKVVLMVNVASFWGLTPLNYPSLNSLVQKFPADKFVVLGFPCGQFENQEPGGNDEIMNCLKYVRPGNGFVPNFLLFSKSHVNGADANPIYQWVKTQCVFMPQLPLMDDVSLIDWTPVTGSDIAWNFEKILITKNGTAYKRYTYTLDPKLLVNDIQLLLSK